VTLLSVENDGEHRPLHRVSSGPCVYFLQYAKTDRTLDKAAEKVGCMPILELAARLKTCLPIFSVGLFVALVILGVFWINVTTFREIHPSSRGYIANEYQYTTDMVKYQKELAKIKSRAIMLVASSPGVYSQLSQKIPDLFESKNAEEASKQEHEAAAAIVGEYQAQEDEMTKDINMHDSYVKKMTPILADVDGTALMIRVFCLGALGEFTVALSTIAGRNLDSNSALTIFASIFKGGMVSIVVFGLFYTDQITIFKTLTKNTNSLDIDYWRMTGLCLIAGAFADRIFDAGQRWFQRYASTTREPQPTTDRAPTPPG